MHRDKRERVMGTKKHPGRLGKIAVFGLLARHGKDREYSEVRLEIVPNVRRRNLQGHIRNHVRMDGTVTIYSDALPSYVPVTPKGWRPSDLYIHKFIDHAEKYVDGQIHTNGLENFWSLLKRSIRGTYVAKTRGRTGATVRPFPHLLCWTHDAHPKVVWEIYCTTSRSAGLRQLEVPIVGATPILQVLPVQRRQQ